MREREKKIYELLDENSPSEIFFIPYSDPFKFLVSVILSASSTDKRAVENSGKLFALYPTCQEIASLDQDEVRDIIYSSGLSQSKSRTIIETARYFSKNGMMKNREELLSIPGIGEKTASCYMQRVFGEPNIVVDTHVERVSLRLGLSASSDRIKTMNELKKLFDESLWNRLSDTLNYFGRTLCRPRPRCGSCFLKDYCIDKKVQ